MCLQEVHNKSAISPLFLYNRVSDPLSRRSGYVARLRGGGLNFAPYISNFKFRPAISLSSSLKSGRFLQDEKKNFKHNLILLPRECVEFSLLFSLNLYLMGLNIFNFLFDVCAFRLIYTISCLALSDGWGVWWRWADSKCPETGGRCEQFFKHLSRDVLHTSKASPLSPVFLT